MRDFLEDDWPAVHAYGGDADVVRYQQWGPNSEDDTKKFVSEAIKSAAKSPRIDFEFAIIFSQSNELIGSASIHISDTLNREGWIGYCLHKKRWNQGIGSETAKALISFGFSQLALHRIFATVDPANIASVNILRKNGMVQEGHFRKQKFVRGVWRDTDLYAVLETD